MFLQFLCFVSSSLLFQANWHVELAHWIMLSVYLACCSLYLCIYIFLLIESETDGGGGKGTWGKLLDTDDDIQCDRNDPNYDTGEVALYYCLRVLFQYIIT